jgi:hypothetical protein
VRDLTDEEQRAIDSLKRLAKRWPRTLKLVSMDGSLAVILNGDPRYDFDHGTGSGAERQQCIIADIEGIPNDGGEW